MEVLSQAPLHSGVGPQAGRHQLRGGALNHSQARQLSWSQQSNAMSCWLPDSAPQLLPGLRPSQMLSSPRAAILLPRKGGGSSPLLSHQALGDKFQETEGIQRLKMKIGL